MQPKSTKVNLSTQAENMEAAVIELSERFVRPNKTGARVVRQPTEFNMADLCQPLIDGWSSGKVAYGHGTITLVFSDGKVAKEADLIIFNPEQGSRFLYSRRPEAGAVISSPLGDRSAADGTPLQLSLDDAAVASSGQQKIISDVAVQLQALEQAFSRRLESQTGTFQSALQSALQSQAKTFQEVLQASLAAQAEGFTEQLKLALEDQAAAFSQTLSKQITATALHFSQRLDDLQTQMNHMAAQVEDLKQQGMTDAALGPQTEAEWLQRLRETWGTVGDYEQYSSSYREANAESPLFYTPDWVCLCELDWARKLSPTLALLYDLMHDKDGIGYAGADILQQFGCHVDPQTGEHYYVYHLGGFTAYEALWQTVVNPDQSWLPELQKLGAKLRPRRYDLFKLFGWEQEAIDSLESVVERARQAQQSSYDSRSESQRKADDTISDYLTLLNIGPFTPITLETVKRAYKQAMKTAHPDTGGSTDHAQRVNEAYKAVLQHYFPDNP